MTVYVDNARIPAMVAGIAGHWSHLTADTKEELFKFAARLGLRVSWLQDNGDGRWHFDVTDIARNAAIRAGAKPIDIREMGEFIRQRRQTEAEGAIELPRMRLYRGRVMHRVRRRDDGGYESICRGRNGMAQSVGPPDSWTAGPAFYPHCRKCS